MSQNFNKQMSEVKRFSEKRIREFLLRIAHNIPVGVRLVLDKNSLKCSTKLSAISILNEFQHEINTLLLVNRNKKTFESEQEFEAFSEYIVRIANQENSLVREELSFCVGDAFNSTTLPIE